MQSPNSDIHTHIYMYIDNIVFIYIKKYMVTSPPKTNLMTTLVLSRLHIQKFRFLEFGNFGNIGLILFGEFGNSDS